MCYTKWKYRDCEGCGYHHAVLVGSQECIRFLRTGECRRKFQWTLDADCGHGDRCDECIRRRQRAAKKVQIESWRRRRREVREVYMRPPRGAA